MSEILTVEQAANYLKVSTKTIHRLIKSEEILASKVGGCWRIRQIDIEEYLKRKCNVTEA